MSLCFFLLLLTEWLCQEVRLSPGVLRVSLIPKYNENNQLKQITHFWSKRIFVVSYYFAFFKSSVRVYTIPKECKLCL